MTSNQNHKVDAGQWVDLYSDYLFSYAVSRVYSKETAHDLVQDTFLSALKAYSSFEAKSSVRTWLVSILKNKIIDHYRKNARNVEDQIIDSPFRDGGDFSGHWLETRAPKGKQFDADTMVSHSEFMQVLTACLERLTPQAAAVFSLKVMEELESSEVCKEVGISSSNLWVILHRARLQMRECLETNWIKE
jgi:RNA polymerase sigma-70 factor (ECF subfamily)